MMLYFWTSSLKFNISSEKLSKTQLFDSVASIKRVPSGNTFFNSLSVGPSSNFWTITLYGFFNSSLVIIFRPSDFNWLLSGFRKYKLIVVSLDWDSLISSSGVKFI